MASDDLFLAIDIGTTNTKVAIFTSGGQLLSSSEQRCTASMINHHYEIDAESWWSATKRTVAGLPRDLKKRVSLLSITGQGPTIVPVNENGQIAHKAIMWLDTRGGDKVESILKMGADEQTAATLAKLIWLNDRIEDKAYLLQPADYICMKLTGKLVNMSFDAPGFRPPWCQSDVMQRIGLQGDFFEADFVAAGSEIAGVIPHVAQELGIPSSVRVIAGAQDFAAALVGTGTVEDGYLCDRGGTSQGVNLCTKKKVSCDGLMTSPFLIEGYWKISGVMNTTGKAVDWFCLKVADCKDLLKDASDILDDVKRPTNLIFLPYLNGERSPYWNVNARGVFFGVALEVDRMRLLVSIMEGVGFAIADVVNRMEAEGCIIKKVRTTGGQASNPLWNQIKADILDKEIEVPSVSESELLGTAIFAMSFAYRETIAEISKKVVKIANVFSPDHERHDRYMRLFEVYRELYRRNKDLFDVLTELR